ncbi:MAG: hypothetical protein A3E80_00415 [Chlamydiae bacterium RIFCSPHIGHO2_12_FULL_49_9]|nr:MAG: hypothetical protein A3E80_00415 [Chlamydiae bacterium RIFCSPHIGHO2_12_FULL_49_9]
MTPDAEEALKGALHAEKDLQQAVSLVHAQENPGLKRFQTFRIHREKSKGKQKEICFAIIDVASRFLQFLSENVRLEKKEGWARLKAAAALCQIDLENKYGAQEALTDKESKLLGEQVRKVTRLGSPAAFLWKKLKEEKTVDVAGLKALQKAKSISKDQFKILKSAFESVRGALKKESFSELDPKTQGLFFSAADKYSKKILIPPLVEWTLPQIEEESKEEEAKSDQKTPSTGSDERVNQLMEEIRLEYSPAIAPEESSDSPAPEIL